MPFSDEFRKKLRRNRRELGADEGMLKAFKDEILAGNEVNIFQDRKPRTPKFKKQKTSSFFGDMRL